MILKPKNGLSERKWPENFYRTLDIYRIFCIILLKEKKLYRFLIIFFYFTFTSSKKRFFKFNISTYKIVFVGIFEFYNTILTDSFCFDQKFGEDIYGFTRTKAWWIY